MWGGPPGPRESPRTHSSTTSVTSPQIRRADGGVGCGPGGPPYSAGPDQAEPFECQILIHMPDIARSAGDHSRVSASRDDPGIGAEFFDQALHHAVDCPDGAVVKPGLHAGYRVPADDTAGFAEVDQGQSRGAAEQSFGRDTDAGRDYAAQVFRFSRNRIERDRGAQI